MSRPRTEHEHAGLWVNTKSPHSNHDKKCVYQPSYGGFERQDVVSRRDQRARSNNIPEVMRQSIEI